ncbi:MAG: hypothetical protein QOG96_4418 [Pseudonocardiales bacterium]|nr:hypothetical protein [Pseudonocardiales bacterium]
MGEAPRSERERPPSREDLEWSTRRKIQVILGSVGVVVLLAVLCYAVPALLKKPAGVVAAPAAQGQILQLPADAPGADPFSPSVAAPLAAPAVGVASTTAAEGGSGVNSALGDTASLYAGTAGSPGSEPARLVSYLQGDPSKAGAWAQVQGIPSSNITSFISALTPVLLRSDTRVTDYAWQNGQSVARQSVLQAGTAVLVDAQGQPRVRAASGNPLLPPVPVPPVPLYSGTSWEGFSPRNLVVVEPAPSPVDHFVLFDLATGQTFVRPAGTLGTQDVVSATVPHPAAPSPPAPVPAPVAVVAASPTEESDNSHDSDDSDDSGDSDDHWSHHDHDGDGGGGHHDGDGHHDGHHDDGHGGHDGPGRHHGGHRHGGGDGGHQHDHHDGGHR